MAVGERANPWVEHVRRFARENNMTYGCALSDARIKDGYTKSVRRSAPPKPTVTGREAYASMPTMERYGKAKVMVVDARPPKIVSAGKRRMSDETKAYLKARRKGGGGGAPSEQGM
jgi:hypothetical protein